jgi:hypothetical protein
MNAIKVKVVNMAECNWNNSGYRNRTQPGEPRYATEYSGTIDFNGAPFNFKFYPDTYRAQYPRENEQPNHRFSVVGLDLETLKKIGTELDFTEAIEIFNKNMEQFVAEKKEWDAKEQRKSLENCAINKNRAAFVAAGFTVNDIDQIINNGGCSKTLSAFKKIVNPHNEKDVETLQIDNREGTYDVHLNYNFKSRGRITKIENAIKKAKEFESEWLSTKESEKNSLDYKNSTKDHVMKVFGVKEIEVSEDSYRDCNNNYVRTGDKFTVAKSMNGCYNGAVTLKAKKENDGSYGYNITTNVSFNEAEMLDVVALIKKSIERQDAEDMAEKNARKSA